MSLLIEISILLVILVLCFYIYSSWQLNHFKRRGIPYIPGYPIVGNNGPIFCGGTSPLDHVCTLYNKLNGHRFGGIFQFTLRHIMIRDPELIKQIFVKDFDYFVNRWLDIPEEGDMMFGGSLFASTGKKWRALRSTLSPAFTSSKIKFIFRTVSEVGRQMVEHLHRQCGDKHGEMLEVETRELWTNFTSSVIVTSAFGIECNCFKDPDNHFVKIAKLITDFTGIQGFIFLGFILNWKLMKFLGFSMTRPRVVKFLLSLARENISTREREGIVRPDIMHLLMLARKGKLEDEDSTAPKHKGAELDENAIASLMWNFYFAGVETTTILLKFATNKLAVLPEVQQRAQAEVDRVLEEDGGELTYEGVASMKYLDMLLSETLRLYPSVPTLDRRCTRPYVVPATATSPELVLQEGDVVTVFTAGIQRDPQYYSEPEKFDPERFSEENKQKMQPFTFLPFGVGPRNCIGSRMALMEAKVALAYLLYHFDIHVIDKTPIDIQLSKKGLQITVDGGLWVGLTPRKK